MTWYRNSLVERALLALPMRVFFRPATAVRVSAQSGLIQTVTALAAGSALVRLAGRRLHLEQVGRDRAREAGGEGAGGGEPEPQVILGETQ